MSLPITLSGSCLCGGVKYRVACDVLTAFGIAQHWNVASKASWFEITDDLPQHAVVPA